MFKTPSFRSLAFGILAVTLLSASGIARAQEAGRILMSIGEVSIKREGAVIPAKRGLVVNAGDSIVTGGASNAQVKFSDGAVVALRSDTEFKVNEYKFSGKADGSEKASVSLVKGGVRAVTGVIGRGNRDNLKVDAVVATVGIRGTGFNIVFCDATCKANNPASKEGLYAGVFEGKIAVGNQAGSTSDLGVNRFAYVQDEKSQPQLLIAPPNFLKDSLESQVRVRPKEVAMNSATENNAATAEKSTAVANAPTPASNDSSNVSSEKVSSIRVAITQPDFVDTFPKTFFDNATGSGSLPANNVVARLRAARFDPNTASPQTAVIDTNQAILGYSTVGTSSADNWKIVSFGDTPTPYSVQSQYWKEGGRSGVSDGQVISWGRWAGDPAANLGQYGIGKLEDNQGFHYIFGFPATVVPTGSLTMNLVGGTVPTEVRTGAEGGWRLTGGSVTMDFATRAMSGVVNLYATKSTGSGNFDMTWDHTMSVLKTSTGATNPGSLESFTTTVKRTNGSIPLCVSGCGGQATLGLYGPNTGAQLGQATHAGMAYSFNTGSYSVQGAAVFKK